jgi:predicted ArsR family transcriptional regulator
MNLFNVFVEKVGNTNLRMRNLGADIKELIKKAHEMNITISILSKKFGRSRVTIWRHLNRLEKLEWLRAKEFRIPTQSFGAYSTKFL